MNIKPGQIFRTRPDLSEFHVVIVLGVDSEIALYSFIKNSAYPEVSNCRVKRLLSLPHFKDWILRYYVEL
jgi:hypothetical protein